MAASSEIQESQLKLDSSYNFPKSQLGLELDNEIKEISDGQHLTEAIVEKNLKNTPANS